jgi:riboflavin biosynthesis pyrimidine reductase
MLRLFPPPTPQADRPPADESGGGAVHTETGDTDNTVDTVGTDNTVGDVAAAVAAEERHARPGRPWVMTNMIATIDGATAVDGLSGGLGGAGDKAVFMALRAVADVIVAGASTVREEQYRAPTPSDEVMADRVARGQAPRPRIAVVTRSLNLDLDLPLFDGRHRPFIITTESAAPERLEPLAEVAEVIQAGEASVDLAAALGQLAERQTTTVLCEGGPSLNGQFVADGLVDEWNLTISPTLLAGDARRAAVGPLSSGPPGGMELSRVWADDSFLFCRWVTKDG